MKYAKITNGEVELYPIDFEEGAVEVARVTDRAPLNQFNHDLKPVQQNDGSWKEVWVQVETSQEEADAKTSTVATSVIASRNQLLQLSDWTQLPDAPITNKQEWAAYRQALRDVPAQAGFPFEINWPALP